ncbi:type II secretion system F family protein [Mucilaginibacter sp. UR6-1]|uniref:type II secretion system F family protein n=1 Tax=Mucilaginibacter sp. UR6-1 TaxID=1435643 RepID=UPI001E5FE765|nr:type II secretion system F family protein [Mucilaginibacter sp. UR6-1]MCC8409344.1 type II secretion system F family protein [Mucilaginibacter sp. UR6-1]
MPSINIKRFEKKVIKPQAKKNDSDGLRSLLNREISFGGNGLPDKKKEALYLELSSLLEAGIDLKSSFELVTADQEKEKDRRLFETIQKDVLSGATFSDALSRSNRFSLYEIYSLQIGEETGKLVEVLKDLARYYQNKIKQRRKVISALTYPCIVMATSFGAIFFMLRFVVPMFGDIFKRFGGELPWITRQTIALSNLMGNILLPGILLTVTLAIIGYRIRKEPTFRRISTAITLRMPIVGPIVQKIYLARFCNAMRLLIVARLPLLRAIALCRQMIGYYPIEASLTKVEADILNGTPLHTSMQQFNIYPDKMVQLIKVGEETNQLEFFFGRVADQYIEEVEYKTSNLSSTMEPLIIVFLGLVVGLIVVSMYLPLFQMSNVFQ